MSSIAYVMLCGARDRSCGQQAVGTSITTMLQHIPHTWFRLFWRKTRLLWYSRFFWYGSLQLLDVPQTQGRRLRYFSNNENLMRALNTTSFKCCLPSTEPMTGGKKFTYAYDGSRSPHASNRHWNPPGFRKKYKFRYFSNRSRITF